MDGTGNTQENSQVENPYDAVPYLSYPIKKANPLVMQGIARLFGLEAVSPNSASILEVGCAAGETITSIAAIYPGSHCVGVDYSAKQVEQAKKNQAAFGIKNLEFKHMSIADMRPDFGKFDYIIFHGIFSWVPVELQPEILRVCKENLTQNGVAYVSYNTYPGWNIVMGMREMMMFHVKGIKDPLAMAEKAKELLSMVEDFNSKYVNYYGDFISTEKNLIDRHYISYFLHEHLEVNNFPVYFYQFAEMMTKQRLQYLWDLETLMWFYGSPPEEYSGLLASAKNKIEREQYCDFFLNRRFRTTLMCHDSRKLLDNMNLELIKNAHVISNFEIPEGFMDADVKEGKEWHITCGGRMSVDISSDDLLAMIQFLGARGRQSTPFQEVMAHVYKVQNGKDYNALSKADRDLVATAFINRIRSYIYASGLTVLFEPFSYVTQPDKKPVVMQLARMQAYSQDWVTTYNQEAQYLNEFQKKIVIYLDGTHDATAVAAKLAADYPDTSADEMVKLVSDAFNDFGRYGILTR